MKHTYNISGMSCGSCAAKVKSTLLTIPEVTLAEVDKSTDTASIAMSSHIALSTLQEKLKALDPKYDISPSAQSEILEQSNSWWAQYRPILLVFLYLLLVTLLIQWRNGVFDLDTWMTHFMGGFFLTFSFFKMLDLSGFANSYMSYDIIAKRWKRWGYVYACIELGLGISYLMQWSPLITNIIAFTVMTISIIGVLQSVLNKRKIQCACLGSVFDLPMSTVTIIEDGLMIMMSGYMIYNLI